MLLLHVLLLVQVALALNAPNSVLNIHVSVTHHVIARTHTSVAQLGVMLHRIACSHAEVVKTASAPMELSASHTPLVTKIILSCAVQVSMMPLPVHVLVHQGVAVSAFLGSLASLTQHVVQSSLKQTRLKRRKLDRRMKQTRLNQDWRKLNHQKRRKLDRRMILHTYQVTRSIVGHRSLMRQLSALRHVQQGSIRSVLMVKNALLTLLVPTERHIFVVQA
jgi:hypothetical protein